MQIYAKEVKISVTKVVLLQSFTYVAQMVNACLNTSSIARFGPYDSLTVNQLYFAHVETQKNAMRVDMAVLQKHGMWLLL